MADGVVAPVTDNDVDLGTSSLEFKDGYFDGTLYCDVLNLAGTNHTSVGGNFESKLLHVRDEKASGTASGSFSSGSFATRVLNTVKTNEITSASLSSNQVSLPAGTYFIMARAPSMDTNGHTCQWYNDTDSALEIAGSPSYTSTDTSTMSFVFGRFTIDDTKVFELQHRCDSTTATIGLGGGSHDYSLIMVYAEVMIWQM